MHPIEIQKVFKDFGTTRALDEITLEVRKGEIFGLLGPNGSGKSTLLRILSLLIPPSQGTLLLLGMAARKGDLALLKQMGVAFDQAAHYEYLTGYENAWFFARAYGIKSPEMESRLQHLFTSLSLWERRNDPVAVYSHGMKRKLALIEALAHHPQVILLDEPSLGLDYHARMSLYQIIHDEAQAGASIMVATNDVHEARLLCNRVAVMNRGRLLSTDTPEALIGSLGGFAILNLRLDRPIPLEILRTVEGIEQTDIINEVSGSFQIRILARDDPRILPPLIGMITEHASLLAMDVKRPDLGDVMLRFEGEY